MKYRCSYTNSPLTGGLGRVLSKGLAYRHFGRIPPTKKGFSFLPNILHTLSVPPFFSLFVNKKCKQGWIGPMAAKTGSVWQPSSARAGRQVSQLFAYSYTKRINRQLQNKFVPLAGRWLRGSGPPVNLAALTPLRSWLSVVANAKLGRNAAEFQPLQLLSAMSGVYACGGSRTRIFNYFLPGSGVLEITTPKELQVLDIKETENGT